MSVFKFIARLAAPTNENSALSLPRPESLDSSQWTLVLYFIVFFDKQTDETQRGSQSSSVFCFAYYGIPE